MPDLTYIYVTTQDALPDIARRIEAADVLGLDIETTSLDPRDGEIRLLQLAVPSPDNDHGDIFVIDVFQVKVIGLLLKAMRKTRAIWVIQNAKFEQKWFWWKYRLRLWPVFCTYRASSLIYNGKKGIKHDLDTIVLRELHEVVENTGQGASNWSKPNLSKLQLDYAAEDVFRLFALRKVLRQKLADHGLLQTALIEFNVLFAEGRVELNGIPFDSERWKALANKNKESRIAQREKLLEVLPHPYDQISLPGMTAGWNPDSPKQMLEALRKSGLKLDSTLEIELAQHAAKHPEVKLLIDYRHVAQLVKTYGHTFLRHVEKDGRVHPEYYGQLLTGRYSANKSLQQVPRSSAFRECFRPLPGRLFIGCDYSGIEMRLCAEVSGDSALCQVFIEGLDAHRMTAAIIMDMHPDEVTKKQRQHAKPVNFGLIYGMMPDKLVLYAMSNYGVVLTLMQAKLYRRRYFERYTGIESWHRWVLREGARLGFARSLGGRIRYLDSSEAHNEFFNTPIQSSGADALKTALALVQDRLDKTFGVSAPENPDGPVQIDHHVHDEIILEVDDDLDMITQAETELQEGMKEGMSYFLRRVPVEVEASVGDSWAAIH